METDEENVEKIDCFVIKAENVPPQFFENREVAKRYFRRFGKVKLVTFRPKRHTLLIEYANEDGMLNALEIAGEYNGHIFKITRDTQTIIKKKTPKKDPDPDWTDDPEIRAELEAMGGITPLRSYELRQQAMAVDPPETQVSKTKRQKWKGASPKPQKKSFSSEESDLLNLIKQQAHTIEDKFRILDARDKLIRIRLKKNIELTKATATVGTCPDMCPEKERLMRETQHQVALYEQEEGGKAMNPRLAVKQYSRSSADQEAPLPQELRPVGVLQMTMGYLMHRIMGLCDVPDVNLAEWYHFLWDRTRGIRKDITQQELCCQGSVELVEQCARFHIFCSARLVAEEPSVFDQKINTENLTKCLQTLKYMYHDLALKNEECINEPEFRAYIILLNLNDGNFMWEVQQLKEHIQQSEEVRFALDVYSSLDRRNYVKFFKLVKSTTFLNACILMRYFIQIRLSALKAFVKSYSPRVSQTSIPVHYLTKILAFENSEATIEFFESYGLFTNIERTKIILDKSNFGDPEFPLILERAIKLVESKRENSIGEVVCGKELPPKLYEKHIPLNSFDENGFLTFTPDLHEADMGKKEKFDEPPPVFKPIDEPLPVFKPITTVPSIFSQTNKPNLSIFAKKPEEPQMSTSKSIWPLPQTQGNIFAKVGSIATNIFGAKILPQQVPSEPEIPQKSEEEEKLQEEVELRKLEEEKRRREEFEKQRELERERQIRDEERRRKLLEEQERKRRLEEAQRFEEMKRRMEEEAKRKQERKKNIEIKAAVTNILSDILDTVEEKLKREKLAEIKERIRLQKLKKIVKKWREYSRRNRKRKAIDFNPPWYGFRSVSEEAHELHTNSQALVLSNIKRYKSGKPFEIPIKEDVVSKIDLCDLTYKLLVKKFWEVDKKLRNELFWKVTISLPNETEFRYGLNHIERTLDSCVNWQKRENSTVLIQQSKLRPTLTYCLEKQKGFVVNTRNDTNGFIFLANNFNDVLSKRIVENFKNYGVFVKVPIVLILQNYDEAKPSLATLTQQGIISDSLILVDKFTSRNLVNLLEEALIFLSTRIEKTPPLEMNTLESFLTNFLCTNLWNRCNSFAKWNSNYKQCLKNPNTVIYLHNEALDRIKNIVLDDSCSEFSKFPTIFHDFLRSNIPETLPCDYKYFPSFWDNLTYLEHLRTVLDSLKLPNFLENWPPTNQVDLEMIVANYCSGAVTDPEKLFYKLMSVFLTDLEQDFSQIRNVMWTDIVELIVLEKLNQTDFSLYGTGFVNKSVYSELIVVYNVNKLDEFLKSDWFYVSHPIIKPKIYELLQQQETVEEIVDTREIDVIDIDIDEMYKKIVTQPRKDMSKIKNEFASCKALMTDLKESTVIHKKILETSGSILRSLVEEK